MDRCEKFLEVALDYLVLETRLPNQSYQESYDYWRRQIELKVRYETEPSLVAGSVLISNQSKN